HGIFNIWKMDLASGTETQLTSVLGGAFMPEVGESGDILYSEYRWDGYKIAVLRADQQPGVAPGAYKKPLYAYERDRAPEGVGALNAYNDVEVPFFTEAEMAAADTADYNFTDPALRADDRDLTLKPYD